jgi:hypothetical protein
VSLIVIALLIGLAITVAVFTLSTERRVHLTGALQTDYRRAIQALALTVMLYAVLAYLFLRLTKCAG